MNKNNGLSHRFR